MLSKFKVLLILVFLSRLAFAVVLHYNGQWHGDEYNHESGARYLIGKGTASYYEIVNLLKPKTEVSYNKHNVWVVKFVLENGLIHTTKGVLTGHINFPLFYFFIACFYKAFGYNPLIYRLFSALLSFMSIILILHIGSYFNIDDKYKKRFLVMCIFSPLLIQYSGTFYKEPIAQCLFYSILLLHLKKKHLILIPLTLLLLLLRPASFIVLAAFMSLFILLKTSSLSKRMLGFSFAILMVIPTDISIFGRDIFHMQKSLYNTTLLSKIPAFDATFGLKLVSLLIFLPISLLQPILFIYGCRTEFNYLNLLWQLQSIEWIHVLPLIIGAFFILLRQHQKSNLACFSIASFVIFFLLSAYGSAGYESVRYRDLLYPMVLLLSLNEIRIGYYKFAAVLFLPVYALGVIYGFLKWTGYIM